MSMPASIRLPRQLRCHVHQPPLVFSGQGSFGLFFLVPTSTLLSFILTHALRILCASTLAMASFCNHDQLKCSNLKSWPKDFQPNPWEVHRLDRECRGYEESNHEFGDMIRQHQPGPLTDHETDVDPQEPEDEMNNLPSPKQKRSPFWTPQYQARREARRRLWSPPITPPMPGIRHYSLQPSQRPPSATPRPSSRARNLRPPDFRLQQPPKSPHNAIRKPRPHRPITRSMKASSLLSLHLRKGLLEITSPAGRSSSVSFTQCMEEGVSCPSLPTSTFSVFFPSGAFSPAICQAVGYQKTANSFSQSIRALSLPSSLLIHHYSATSYAADLV